MPEADYWSIRLEFVSTAIDLVALTFTIVSIYITGLYFYLARASLVLRVLGFVAFTVAFAFLAALAVNLKEVSDTVLYCAGCGPAGEGERDFWVNDGARAGAVLAAIIYVGLFVMTFITGWRSKSFPQSLD